MKLVKLSLAAIAIVGMTTSSFASADSVSEAFKNGKVNGDLKGYYFSRDKGVSSSESILTGGIELNYVTDSFKGFKFGTTVQSSASPFADIMAKNVFKGDMYGSGAVLSEGYLSYSLGMTTAKIGRQYIKTPLLKLSGSRLVKQSFEGLVIVNKDIPKTTLIAAYVNKFQGMTNMNGNIGEFTDLYEDGAFAGIGGGPFGTYYTKSEIGKSIGIVNRAGTEAFAIDTNYSFKGAKVGARYVTMEANSSYEESRYNLYGSYKFSGALKGLKTDLVYENQGKDADLKEMWFKASYKF